MNEIREVKSLRCAPPKTSHARVVMTPGFFSIRFTDRCAECGDDVGMHRVVQEEWCYDDVPPVSGHYIVTWMHKPENNCVTFDLLTVTELWFNPLTGWFRPRYFDSVISARIESNQIVAWRMFPDPAPIMPK